MKVMILAAGFGRRMLPLTEKTAKPLLKIGRYSLIEHLIYSLSQQGFTDIVINIHHHADKIKSTLNDGSQYQTLIQYVHEDQQLLGTGGGVANALPLLGQDPFILISGDIFTDFNFASLPQLNQQLGHLILIDNPDFHPQGDFNLEDNQQLTVGNQYTYANIAILSPQLFQYAPKDTAAFSLAPLFHQAIDAQRLTGSHYCGAWNNVGTPAILDKLNQTTDHTHLISD